jgi:cytoskeleton protein RodZ
MSTETVPETQTLGSGPGAMLRRAREAKGLHISVLATSLRVPVDRIRALESEQWADLPDLVFARALTMSVCRHLKIDSAPVLAGMPDPDPLRSVRVTAAISQPLGGVLSPSRPRRNLWLALVVLALALLAWVVTNADRDARPTATVEVPEMPPTPAAATDAPASGEGAPTPAGNANGAAEAEKPAAVILPLPANKP